VRWPWQQPPRPGPWVVSNNYRRRVVDLLTPQMIELNAIRDAMLLARVERIKLTGTVLGTAWTISRRAEVKPFAAALVYDPDDTLTLTVEFERR
jgi:hypothetical protein